MKLHYYPETDSLYIELKNVPGTQMREIVQGLNVDLDANGDGRLRYRSCVGQGRPPGSRRLRFYPRARRSEKCTAPVSRAREQ